MLVPTILAASIVGTLSQAAVTLESAAMYGLVVLVIGLIAWSKYSDPAPSDPYASRRAAPDLPERSHADDVGPVATGTGDRVPALGREQQ